MDFLSAMQHRFACKLYDRQRMLDDSEIQRILEYGRLTPLHSDLSCGRSM